MPLNVKDNGGADFKPAPQGTHIAVCNLVCDCGVQSGGRFKPRQKLYLRWEIPGERTSWTDRDGKEHEGPMQIGKFYTASLSQKAKLRADLESWRGRLFTPEELAGFNLFNVLGIACQIGITHASGNDGKVYANVSAVMGLPKGMPRPKAERPLIKYSPDEPQQFDQLPGWLQERVKDAQGAAPAETVSHVAGDEDFDDEIPF